MMGHLNSFSASGGGNLNKNFPKIQMPGGLPGGGMLKLRFDWYITRKMLCQSVCKAPFEVHASIQVTFLVLMKKTSQSITTE